jgi:hypothetical protein
MLASKPKRVVDLYDWLPTYGETRVEFVARELTLQVEVFYDSASGSEEKKKLVFGGVCAFFVSSVPGVELLRFQYEGTDASGALVEFENSEAARMWRESAPWRSTRHYQVFFLAANMRLEVFAEEFRLEG